MNTNIPKWIAPALITTGAAGLALLPGGIVIALIAMAAGGAVLFILTVAGKLDQ